MADPGLIIRVNNANSWGTDSGYYAVPNPSTYAID